jgi:hypothetical protein
MRRNIDAWWPHVEAGVEAIVVTASGCGVQVRDYGHALADDPVYAEKAARISALCRDPAEVVGAERPNLQALLGGRARDARQAGLPFALYPAARAEDPRRHRRDGWRPPATTWFRSPTGTCAAVRPAPIRCSSRNCRGACATTSWRR